LRAGSGFGTVASPATTSDSTGRPDVGGKAVVGDMREVEAAAKASGRHDVLMRAKTAKAIAFVAMPVGNG